MNRTLENKVLQHLEPRNSLIVTMAKATAATPVIVRSIKTFVVSMKNSTTRIQTVGFATLVISVIAIRAPGAATIRMRHLDVVSSSEYRATNATMRIGNIVACHVALVAIVSPSSKYCSITASVIVSALDTSGGVSEKNAKHQTESNEGRKLNLHLCFT